MKLHTLAIATLLSACAQGAAAQSTFTTPDPAKWYRLVTCYNGSGVRVGRCIEYNPANHDYLWSADQVAETSDELDYQLWAFVPSPDNEDLYAMVCKAYPNGYVSTNPTSIDASGRWTYVTDPSANPTDKYGFEFVTTSSMSGVDSDGNSYCAITTVRANNSGWCMNCGATRQDYAINLWYETYSEEANEWLFKFVEHRESTTGLTSVESPAPPQVYDLQGRRLAAPVRGLNIINGHKVLF